MTFLETPRRNDVALVNYNDGPCIGDRIAWVDWCFRGYGTVVFFGYVGGDVKRAGMVEVQMDRESFRRLLTLSEVKRVIGGAS